MVTKLPLCIQPEHITHLSVLSGKFYFLEIRPVHQKLESVKCMMLKTLNSKILLAFVTEQTREIRFVCIHTDVVGLCCDAG